MYFGGRAERAGVVGAIRRALQRDGASRRRRQALVGLLALAVALAIALPLTAAFAASRRVDRGVVDVTTRSAYQDGTAAGTGIVLTSSGEVLTNNHVIAGATSITVRDVGTGRTYRARVVGTDATDDVAVLQLRGASGLTTATLGSSSGVSVGDAVKAVGNAGGVGGTPAVASGTVTALRRAITVGDPAGGDLERLRGLIQTNARLEPGDSGGPLLDSAGRVVGINTAASAEVGFRSGSSEGYAIPIDRALTIAKQIEAGRGSATVHIGPRAFIGIQVAAGPGYRAGVLVGDVFSGSPAEGAGLEAGDLIVTFDGRRLASPAALTSLVGRHHPGDSVKISWRDQYGVLHRATVHLATGPAA
jgi:S1-C subfamily serine protease